MTQFRYLVSNVDAAIAFYTDQLAFTLEQQFGPAMAILNRDDLQLWLAGPEASASQPMPDGSRPVPGGWNRIVLVVDDLHAQVQAMSQANIPFLNNITSGPGGQQILCADPSGNLIELFEPAPPN